MVRCQYGQNGKGLVRSKWQSVPVYLCVHLCLYPHWCPGLSNGTVCIITDEMRKRQDYYTQYSGAERTHSRFLRPPISRGSNSLLTNKNTYVYTLHTSVTILSISWTNLMCFVTLQIVIHTLIYPAQKQPHGAQKHLRKTSYDICQFVRISSLHVFLIYLFTLYRFCVIILVLGETCWMKNAR